MSDSKKIRIGINGFGRIGRVASRIILGRPELELAAVNSRSDVSSHAYLLQYDTAYGTLPLKVSARDGKLDIEGKGSVAVFNNDDPGAIPWGSAGVDIVIDATGKFRTGELLQAHLHDTVKFAVLSAPAKDSLPTVVMGVNHETLDVETVKVVSNSSCTTNCLSTTLKVLHDAFGVVRGFMTTTHAVTDSQNLLDNSHKKEVRLRRAAFGSMIPASTGSAKDVGKLFPVLQGKIICQSVRVPLLTVSLINLVVETGKVTDADGINRAFSEAAAGSLHGILSVNSDELVSKDFTGDTHSSIVDLPLTRAVGGNLISVSAWYDNEWGYTSRLVDLVVYIGRKAGLI